MANPILVLFPRAVRQKLVSRAPKLEICPICRTVYRRTTGRKFGCSTTCIMQVRFWKYVEKTETCWLWTGALTQGHGYGFMVESVGNVVYVAHRYSSELHVGPIPADMTIDHLCRVRHCVRPDHLEVVTRGENTLRGEGWAGTKHRQTACIHGHPFDDVNTYVTSQGRRQCRICRLVRVRRSYHQT